VGLRALRSVLVGDPDPALFSHAAVAFGRILIAPGADIAFHETPGYAFVAVESGTLVLEVGHDGTALERVAAGSATSTTPGTAFALHNLEDAPVSVMVATIEAHDAVPEALT
jgi:hypothetical protein